MMHETSQFVLIYQKYIMHYVEKHAILQRRLDICNNKTNLIECRQKSKSDHRVQMYKILPQLINLCPSYA